MSYIGKNPKVDSVKLEGSETAASGTAEGQLYYNTGTGSISKGLKVFKNNQFVSIDKQLGDADTFHLLKASDISTAEFSAARNSTSTSFLNQNAVPFETTTASGAAGTFSNSSTGDALLTDESADLVFAYKSSGTSDDAQEYFGIPLSIPKAFRGGNIVLSFEYRTGFGTGTTATVDGDFEVAVLDKSTGNGAQTTTTATSGTAIAAGSNIAVASKTGLAVGQRVRLETGSSTIAAGSPDATVTEAFITSISTSTDHITISKDYAPPSTSGGRITSGWLTDVVPGQLPTADSQTNKQGKKFSIQFKTEEDTSDIVLFFQNKNTSSTISRHLFVDNILLSANKFLQASSQLKSEYYYASGNSNFWNDLNSNSGWDADLVVSGFGAPPVAQSKFLRFEETSTTDTRVYARQDIDLAVSFTGHAQAGNQIKIYNSSGQILAQQQTPDPAGHVQNNSVFVSIALAKDDYMYCVNDRGSTASNRYGAASFLATGRNSDVILLESQDEIFTDWNDYTPTTSLTGGTISTQNGRWRRVGSDMEIEIYIRWSSIFTGGTAVFTLPSGYSIDTSKLITPLGDEEAIFGTVMLWDDHAGAPHYGKVAYSSSTQVKASYYFTIDGNNYLASTPSIDTTTPFTWAANDAMFLQFKVPISGFSADFNPLLSMPLVEIGANLEYYSAFNFTGGSSKSYRAVIRNPSTDVVTNSVSNLGTVSNDTTNGWYFEANQRVKVTINFALSSGTGVTGASVVKFGPSDTPSSLANNNNGNSQWHGKRVVGPDESPGTGYKVSSGGSFIMEAGEYIQVVQDTTSFQDNDQNTLNMVVEKDFSNTNMAHIIKPAVALLKDVKAYNVAGGGSTAGAFNSRELNVIEGESYFVTLSGTGTKGIGGTNVEFTLDPGMYKMTAKVPFVGTNFSSARLYDVTNSKVVKYGSTEYTNISTDASGGSSVIEVVKTITAATQYKIQYRVSDGTGGNALGVEQNTDSTAVSVYTTVEIEKLK